MFEKELGILQSINLSKFNNSNLAESATLTYIHKNFFIRWLFLQRLYSALILLEYKLNSGSNPSTAIDYGCGSGILLPTLAKKFDVVFGIDIYPNIAMQLKEKMPEDFLKIRILDHINKLNDVSADAIIALDVLEHSKNIEKDLNEILSKLAQGGVFIVSGPTENFLYKTLRKVAAFLSKGWFTGDYHFYNIDQLNLLIQKHGVQISDTVNIPAVLPLFKVIIYIKPIKIFD